jgi:hypothetical protein
VIANRKEGLDRLASRIEDLVERRATWRQTPEVQGVLFYLDSMFTNVESDQIESGSFLTLYGDGPACAALVAKLQSAADN